MSESQPQESELRDDLVAAPVTASEVVYRGHVWDIVRDDFQLEGSSITREYMSHTGAVAVLAMDDDGRVLLIKQYRHPIRSRDWELPAGLLDVQGEDPLVAAQRELGEEADLRAARWDLLSEFVSSPGGSNEAIRVYLARDVSATDAVYDRVEEEAGIEVYWVPLDEVVEAVLSRRTQNAIVAIAALSALAARERGWSTLGDASTPWTRHPLQRD